MDYDTGEKNFDQNYSEAKKITEGLVWLGSRLYHCSNLCTSGLVFTLQTLRTRAFFDQR